MPAKGERFPIRDPEKPAEIAERPGDDVVFFQALLEGIAEVEALAYRRLAELGAPSPRRVLTVGGGARNEAWACIRGRVLGVPVSIAAETEAAYGTALLALHGGPPHDRLRGRTGGHPRLLEIADRFDHALLDQWGVLHHGDAVSAGVRDAVAALRRAGKRMLVLSNSGKRAAANAARLAGLGLAPEAYDGLLSSGEACWRLLQRRDRPPFDRIGRHCLLVTRGDDRSVVEGLDLSLAKDVRDADFILLAGLDDAHADPEAWRPRWAEAVSLDLPMICANPDLTMITPAGLAPGAGRIAQLYEALGGDVTYVGKPDAPVYEEGPTLLEGPDPRRVLAIGISSTTISGAAPA